MPNPFEQLQQAVERDHRQESQARRRQSWREPVDVALARGDGPAVYGAALGLGSRESTAAVAEALRRGSWDQDTPLRTNLNAQQRVRIADALDKVRADSRSFEQARANMAQGLAALDTLAKAEQAAGPDGRAPTGFIEADMFGVRRDSHSPFVAPEITVLGSLDRARLGMGLPPVSEADAARHRQQEAERIADMGLLSRLGKETTEGLHRGLANLGGLAVAPFRRGDFYQDLRESTTDQQIRDPNVVVRSVGNVAEMGPSLAVGGGLGRGAVAATRLARGGLAARTLGAATVGATQVGANMPSQYERLVNVEGVDPETAMATTLSQGAAEVGLTMLFSAIGGAGGLEDIITGARQGGVMGARRAAAKLGYDIAWENVEEFSQNVATRALELVQVDGLSPTEAMDQSIAELPETALETFLTTTMLTGGVGAPGVAAAGANKRQAAAADRRNRNLRDRIAARRDELVAEGVDPAEATRQAIEEAQQEPAGAAEGETLEPQFETPRPPGEVETAETAETADSAADILEPQFEPPRRPGEDRGQPPAGDPAADLLAPPETVTPSGSPRPVEGLQGENQRNAVRRTAEAVRSRVGRENGQLPAATQVEETPNGVVVTVPEGTGPGARRILIQPQDAGELNDAALEADPASVYDSAQAAGVPIRYKGRDLSRTEFLRLPALERRKAVLGSNLTFGGMAVVVETPSGQDVETDVVGLIALHEGDPDLSLDEEINHTLVQAALTDNETRVMAAALDRAVQAGVIPGEANFAGRDPGELRADSAYVEGAYELYRQMTGENANRIKRQLDRGGRNLLTRLIDKIRSFFGGTARTVARAHGYSPAMIRQVMRDIGSGEIAQRRRDLATERDAARRTTGARGLPVSFQRRQTAQSARREQAETAEARQRRQEEADLRRQRGDELREERREEQVEDREARLRRQAEADLRRREREVRQAEQQAERDRKQARKDAEKAAKDRAAAEVEARIAKINASLEPLESRAQQLEERVDAYGKERIEVTRERNRELKATESLKKGRAARDRVIRKNYNVLLETLKLRQAQARSLARNIRTKMENARRAQKAIKGAETLFRKEVADILNTAELDEARAAIAVMKKAFNQASGQAQGRATRATNQGTAGGFSTISPRRVTSTKVSDRAERNLNHDLQVTVDAQTDQKAVGRMANALRRFPGMPDRIKRRVPRSRVEWMVDLSSKILRWIHDRVPPDIRERARKWYDGANRMANEMAERFGYNPEQAAGVMAVLSPGKDWFQNLSQAERIMSFVAENSQTAVWSSAMERTKGFGAAVRAREKLIRDLQKKDENADVSGIDTTLGDIVGKSYSDLETDWQRAVFVRAWDEANNPQTYNRVTPEGGFGDSTGQTHAWQDFPFIARGLSMLSDGSMLNISDMLGNGHKLRNFYNNIIAPNAGRDVTIDTHAVAAALMLPLAQKDTLVAHNFGSSPKGVPSAGGSAETGVKGTYPAYADAHRIAAADPALDILPRELQSITWEAVRSLFPDTSKRGPGGAKLKRDINALWKEFANGNRTLESTLEAIVERATDGSPDGAFANPPWLGSGVGRAFADGGSSIPRGASRSQRDRGDDTGGRGGAEPAGTAGNLGLLRKSPRGGIENQRRLLLEGLNKGAEKNLAIRATDPMARMASAFYDREGLENNKWASYAASANTEDAQADMRELVNKHRRDAGGFATRLIDKLNRGVLPTAIEHAALVELMNEQGFKRSLALERKDPAAAQKTLALYAKLATADRGIGSALGMRLAELRDPLLTPEQREKFVFGIMTQPDRKQQAEIDRIKARKGPAAAAAREEEIIAANAAKIPALLKKMGLTGDTNLDEIFVLDPSDPDFGPQFFSIVREFQVARHGWRLGELAHAMFMQNLFSPATIGANVTGNGIMAAVAGGERLVGGVIADAAGLFRGEFGRHSRENAHRIGAIVKGLIPALGDAVYTLATGDSKTVMRAGKLSKSTLEELGGTSAQFFGGSVAGRAASFALTPLLRMISFVDELFRSLAYRSGIVGAAAEQARAEQADGKLSKARYWDRVAELSQNPDPMILERALDIANEMTFKEDFQQGSWSGWIEDRLSALRDGSWRVPMTNIELRPMVLVIPFMSALLRLSRQTGRRVAPLSAIAMFKDMVLFAQGKVPGREVTKQAMRTMTSAALLGAAFMLKDEDDEYLLQGTAAPDLDDAGRFTPEQRLAMERGQTGTFAGFDIQRLDPIGNAATAAANLRDMLTGEGPEAGRGDIYERGERFVAKLSLDLVGDRYLTGVREILLAGAAGGLRGAGEEALRIGERGFGLEAETADAIGVGGLPGVKHVVNFLAGYPGTVAQVRRDLLGEPSDRRDKGGPSITILGQERAVRDPGWRTYMARTLGFRKPTASPEDLALLDGWAHLQEQAARVDSSYRDKLPGFIGRTMTDAAGRRVEITDEAYTELMQNRGEVLRTVLQTIGPEQLQAIDNPHAARALMDQVMSLNSNLGSLYKPQATLGAELLD